ncbi:MAG: hypothetical protein PW788_00785 [Micavibrio sp.]|nr:hypothetical protein [Micavibrio sp.]
MNKLFLTTMAVLTAISLSACATVTPVERNHLSHSTASATDISKAKQSVAAQMKDPGSTQFKNVAGYSYGQPGFTMLCGEVNAKNSFGGYIGYRHFTYFSGVLVMNELEGKGDGWENKFNQHWNESCK